MIEKRGRLIKVLCRGGCHRVIVVTEERKAGLVVEAWDLKSGGPGPVLSSSADLLCDLGLVTSPLWAADSLSVKWSFLRPREDRHGAEGIHVCETPRRMRFIHCLRRVASRMQAALHNAPLSALETCFSGRVSLARCILDAGFLHWA